MPLNYKLEGDGETVVLLHPVGLDLTCWDAVAARLIGKYRLLRVDLRGHGQSPRVHEEMELADFARDVNELFDEIDLVPTALVGLSFGGMVAQTYAMEFPDRLSKLVIAGCPCTLSEPARSVLRARGQAALELGMGPQVEETLQRWFTPSFLAKSDVQIVRARLLATDPAAWNAAWHAIANIDTIERLHEIELPTLCIAGELDPASPPAALMEIASHIRNAEVLVLPETPHMMQIERPQMMAAAISSFLANSAIPPERGPT